MYSCDYLANKFLYINRMNNKNEKGGVLGWIILAIIIILIIFFVIRSGNNQGDSANTTVVEEEVKNISIELENLSDTQPLSPGIIIVHEGEFDFDFAGKNAPAELESLVELGNPDTFEEFALGQTGVVFVQRIEASIEPGQSARIQIPPVIATRSTKLTIFQQIAKSNDGYTFIDANLKKVVEDGTTLEAKNYDAGFEENTELGSGFEGGQTDSEKGEENITNGEATSPQAPVTNHSQLTSPVLKAKAISQ